MQTDLWIDMVARTSNENASKPREIRIPTPYGYLAAQEWGPSDGIPVLALHGWFNNSGTFDRLIPLLSSKLHVIAVDEPGLGLSSRLPAGAIIHFWDYLFDVRRTLEFLKWDKVNILGHSRGGALGQLYASMFPEQVEKVVSIDAIRPMLVPSIYLAKMGGKRIDKYLKYEKHFTNPPLTEYTVEEAINFIVDSHEGSVTHESAKILLRRAARPTEDGTKVVFTRDARLKSEVFVPYCAEDLKEFMCNVKCEMLIIRALDGPFQVERKDIDEFCDIYRKNCKKFIYQEVRGTHHVHLNEPHRVASLISNFIFPEGKL